MLTIYHTTVCRHLCIVCNIYLIHCHLCIFILHITIILHKTASNNFVIGVCCVVFYIDYMYNEISSIILN